ncbi:hypothetical protein [Hymenobacter algoricola]|uniref:UbiA family prenyltransferase n=1 Tax=Hymenobacter algoricola TaxID=486267 RepID=A0ABP7N1L1_9BACT
MNLKNLLAYLNERFPVVNMALFAILFLTVFSVAGAGTPGPGFGAREAVGVLATISFFFRLRVFDEIKDYALDARHHPQRVLQSGRVSLRQLRGLAAVGAGLEAAWSAYLGGPVLVGWLLVVGYSLLMRYEFFVGRWLQPRLVLYAVSHMLIMPLLIGWLWRAYSPDFGTGSPVYTLGLLSLLGGFSFELARKIHAPAAEKDGIASYSKSLGFGGAIGAVLLVLLAGTLVQGYLLRQLHAAAWPFALLAALYLLTLLVYGLSWRRPHEKRLKAGELLVSLFMLSSYLSLIITLNF